MVALQGPLNYPPNADAKSHSRRYKRGNASVRNAARSDATQGPIVRALEAIGARVYYIKWPVDLMVTYRQRTIMLECKSRTGTLTKGQAELVERWNGAELYIVRTPEEALTAILGEKAMT